MHILLGKNMINNIDDIQDIIHYFDELMALNDLIDKYQLVNIDVTGNRDDISFDIVFRDWNDTSKILNVIQRKEVSKYGHIYIPAVTIKSNTTLNIKLSDRLI